MKCHITIFVIMMAVMQAAEPARGQAERPTVAVAPESCVTAECHADVKRHNAMHGPVVANACNACHEPADVERHTFGLTRSKEELCIFCHQVDTENLPVVHEPVTRGECLACHNPHGGFDRNLLRAESMNQLCNTCHQPVAGEHKSVHGPVAAGACGACHAPHASQNPNLLLHEGRDLCFSCHQEMAGQLTTVQFKHEPVEKECTACHDPHAADFPMMTRDAPMQLCTSTCHEDVRHAVTEAKHQHAAVTTDAACINCHTPHGGDLATLMKDKPINLCLKCHAEPIVTEQGTVVSVAEIADPSLIKHGPVADGSCGGCHNVHGSDVANLLAHPYPATFYESFAVDKYDLCFECHDQQLVLRPTTEGLTGFRNGEMNLHYTHVNKDKRGRSCRACHSTHASPNPVHIRQSVPFGNWEMPINYKQTETGGSCSPGCHQTLSYDREHPVNQTTVNAEPAQTSPSTEPAP